MILLTGASGFIGKHLVQALVKLYGREGVLALTSKPIEDCVYLLHHNYTFDHNIFHENGYANSIDTIIHAGSFIPKNVLQGNDYVKCNRNIFYLEKLLNSILPEVRKIVYLSTVDIYKESDLITEDSDVDPVSLYGNSKFYCEKLVKYWADSKNVLSHVLRIGHVYGPGEDEYQKLIPATMKKLLRGEQIELWGKGDDLRAFIYIDDVVNAIVNTLGLTKDIGPVNIASSNSYMVKDILDHIIDVSRMETEIIKVPGQILARNLRFDNSKMTKYLLKRESDLITGLKMEWNYFLNLKT